MANESAVKTKPVDANATDSFLQRWHVWHGSRLDALESPHGYLSPTSITWVWEGDSKTSEDFPGTWSAHDDVLTYTPQAGATVTNAGREVSEALSFRASFYGEEDLALFEYGNLIAEVKAQSDQLHHDRHRFWIRVKNPDSPTRRGFTGIPFYAPTRDWKLPARFELFESKAISTQDTVQKVVIQVLPIIGKVTFTYRDQDYSLQVADVHGTPTIFFSDATSGDTTYGNGRILELGRADARGLNHIDFNRAYNFPCSFTPYCTCPVPTRENRLPFAVEAGEKTPREAQ